MEVGDRIRMVIDSHKLTAGAFADLLGVQRSNVSHILSGRNKPGFEFLEKVVLHFPKVNAHWLLTGKHITNEQSELEPTAKVEEAEKEKSIQPAASNLNHGNVVKTIVFYDDFTFETFIPRK